jgi:hypothetical protein
MVNSKASVWLFVVRTELVFRVHRPARLGVWSRISEAPEVREKVKPRGEVQSAFAGE